MSDSQLLLDSDMPDFRLHGEVALVTGASSGIGLYLAGVLARAGAFVVLAARRWERVEEAASFLKASGCEASAIKLDVSRVETLDSAFADIEAKYHRSPDILVNCAGVALFKPFLEQTVEEVDALFAINLRGAFFVAQRAARGMVAQRKGSIINVASTAGIRPGALLSSYGASKAGLVHLTKVMAAELARYGVRVNVLCPGNIETDMHRTFEDAGVAEALVKRIPQRRFGQCADLAGATLLLASAAGSYMTGAVLAVDGGQLVNSL